MDTDDPFFKTTIDDKTVVKPVPGGRSADIRRVQATPPSTTAMSGGPLPRLGKLNPLESAASGLLALLTQLKNSRSHHDPSGLKNQIIREINDFQNDALHKDVDQKTVSTARYVLCTALDDAVLNTPWGNNSNWAQQSLLSTFHKEVSGGERFFKILKSLGQNPGQNIDLLELMYLCLALGFEGRYRIVENGKDKLAQIRDWLYRLISQERGTVERTLSPHWEGVVEQKNPLLRFMPMWVFIAIAAGLLATLFVVLLLHLNHLSDPVFKQVYSIDVAVTQPPEPPPEPPLQIIIERAPEITLSELLALEIRNNQVNVSENEEFSKVTISGDSLFRSGRADVNKSVTPLLHRVGESLNQLTGAILITGHSDSDPIKTVRFPSNWHLSQTRADAVAKIINANLDEPERITVEGRADLEPIATNDTREGKARNRRVEIILYR